MVKPKVKATRRNESDARAATLGNARADDRGSGETGHKEIRLDVDDVDGTTEESQPSESGAEALTDGLDAPPEIAEASKLSGATSAATSAIAATRTRWLLRNARDTKFVLERIRRAPAAGVSTKWLKQVARETLTKTGPNGKSGALGQFRGHLFEHLDVQAYTLRNLPMRRVLKLRRTAHAPGYDASRFINGRFAGGVQHKLSAAGVVKAADKLNARKAGSAARATLRLPKDQAARATTRVAGRMRVEASEISSAALKRRGNAGLRQLSSRGSAAVSSVHQFGRGAGLAAVTGVALGAASDASKLRRRQMGAQEFVSRRGADAVEQGASYAAGAIATTGVVAGLKSVAAGGGVLAGAATGAASSTVVLPLAVSVAAGGAVLLSMRPLRRRVEVWAAQRSQRDNGRTSSVSPTVGSAESKVDLDGSSE